MPRRVPVHLDAATLNSLTGPLVYSYVRDGCVLYVGMSASGGARFLSPGHHQLGGVVGRMPGDSVYVWPCQFAEEAADLERRLIMELRPERNDVTLGIEAFQPLEPLPRHLRKKTQPLDLSPWQRSRLLPSSPEPA